MPELNFPEPDPRDLDGTQPGKPVKIPAPVPPEARPALPPRPPKGKTGARPQPIPEKRKIAPQPRSHDPRRSAMYLPLWSLALMLLIVLGISFAIILAVLGIGGRSAPGGEPVVVIITAIPSPTPPLPQFAPSLPAPTLPGISNAVPQFPLEGPTLAPVILSPTTLSIGIGAQVRITDQAVRVRPAPSLDNAELFFAEPEDVFTVLEGPQQGSGLTWWRVEQVGDPSRAGWIAANLITVIPPQ